LEIHHVVKRAAVPSADKASRAKYLHWLLDHCLQSESKHIDAIQSNLELLAFALFAVGDQPPEDLRGVLQMLYENENEMAKDSELPGKDEFSKKSRSRRAS
jgi:hypothetical protein